MRGICQEHDVRNVKTFLATPSAGWARQAKGVKSGDTNRVNGTFSNRGRRFFLIDCSNGLVHRSAVLHVIPINDSGPDGPETEAAKSERCPG